MADLTKTIKIVVDATTGNAKKGFADLKADVAGAEGSLGKFKAAASGAGNLLGSLPLPAVAGGVVAVGAAIKGLGDQFAGAALEAKKMSEATGLSVETSSEWIAAADDVGLSAETIEGAFGKATKALGLNEAAFASQGVAIAHAKDGTIDMNATLLNAITTIQGIQDPTQKAALASQLFGKSWADLTPILSQSEGQLRSTLAATSEAQRITDAEVESAKEWQATMDNLGDTLTDLEMTLGKLVVDGMGPALETVSEFAGTFDELVNSLDGGIGGVAKVGEGFGLWLKYLSPVGPAMLIVSKGMEAVSAATERLGVVAGPAGELIGKVPEAIGDFVSSVPGLVTTSEKVVAVLGLVDDAVVSIINHIPGVVIGKALVDGFNAWTDAGEASVVVLEHHSLAAETGAGFVNQLGKSLRAAGVDAEFEAEQAKESAKQLEAQNKAVADLGVALDDLPNSYDAAAGAADGMGKAFDTARTSMFDIHQTAADVIEGQDGLIKSIKDAGSAYAATGYHLTTFTKDGRDQLDQLEKLNQTYGDNYKAILAAGGSYDDVRAKATDYRGELVNQLTQLGLTSDEQQDYLKFLNLTPEQIETTIKLSQADEARQKIALLNVDINNLPKEARTEYVAAINNGDYVTALAVLTDLAKPGGKAREAPVTAVAETAAAAAELNALAKARYVDYYAQTHGDPNPHNAGGGPVQAGVPTIVGDAGRPELFVPSSNGRILPYVPPGGGRAGSPTINVTVNGGGPGVAREVIDELTWAMRTGRVA